jgi:hypothetical protein
MHPWMTGRIVETMHHEARNRAAYVRTQNEARELQRTTAEPRRERFGLAVARFGLRIAGCEPKPELYVHPGWTTCGATSTSSR